MSQLTGDGAAGSRRPDGVIYDIGYRHYDGPRLGTGYILRSLFADSLRGAYGLRRAARTKVLPFLLFAGICLPAVIIASILNFTKGTSLPLAYTGYFFLLNPLIALFVASQAPATVSRDLRYRVMSLYLSRPLTRLGYISAKFLALTVAVFALTAAPVLIMFGGALLGGLSAGTQAKQLAQALVGLLLLSLLLSALGLLIASITPRRGLGVAAIITVLVLLYAIFGVLLGLGNSAGNETLSGYAGLLSPFTLVDGVQAWMFGVDASTGQKPPGSLGGPLYLLVSLAVIGASFGLLNVRYRRVSVS